MRHRRFTFYKPLIRAYTDQRTCSEFMEWWHYNSFSFWKLWKDR